MAGLGARLGFIAHYGSPGAVFSAVPCVGAGVALLRLDGDWYDSTLECLTALEPLVTEEGTVIVDDYYA